MAKEVYLICPVRNASAGQRREMDRYVERLEKAGVSVHYPPRDVDQTDDGVGLELNTIHREAMLQCREVHVFWDPASRGSHFDLGMAMMLRASRDLPVVLASKIESTKKRSYGNIVRAIAEPSRLTPPEGAR